MHGAKARNIRVDAFERRQMRVIINLQTIYYVSSMYKVYWNCMSEEAGAVSGFF